MAGQSIDSVWYGSDISLVGRALGLGLAPLAWAYRASIAARSRLVRPERVDRPVISVGNLTAGGSGKTPLVMELVGLLQAGGRRVAIVSRGYGRNTRGSRVVHVAGDGLPAAEAAGDEPAMMAARLPSACVVVGEDRVDAARLAIDSCRPDAIVCDDAFSHIGLARDLDVLAVHARRGFGNRRLLPAGPLREPLTAMRRAHLVVFTHARDETVAELRIRHGIPEDLPAAACRFEPDELVCGPGLREHTGPGPSRVVAACGIAHPAGFEESLQQAGLQVVDRAAFGDHHRLTARDLERLAERVQHAGAEALVVTEKDLVKMERPPDGLTVLALRLAARWADEASRDLVVKAMERTMSEFEENRHGST